MDIVVFDSQELLLAMSALRGLVPELSARQAQLIQIIARLHGGGLQLEQLYAAPRQLVAACIREPHKRKRLVQLAALLTMVDERVDARAARAVAAFAHELQVDEPAVGVLRKLAAMSRIGARVSLLRRIMGRLLAEAWHDEGWKGVRKILAGFTGGGGDPALAARYDRLEHYPQGSLGRAVWEHCTSHNFALPGRPGAIPENVLFHDVGHVLAGYGTDPTGEIQQAAFQAGFVRKDGFAFLFFGVVQFHLGFKITPVADPQVGLFDLEKVMTALARGAQCTVDLSHHWDFWAVAQRPVAQLRREWSIPPLSAAVMQAA